MMKYIRTRVFLFRKSKSAWNKKKNSKLTNVSGSTKMLKTNKKNTNVKKANLAIKLKFHHLQN